MCAAFDRPFPNPLAVPELVSCIVSHIDNPTDLLNCACVNWMWSMAALQKLYRGSMNDMRYRTPDIGSLNSLYVASRERFARNMRLTEYLTIAPETPAMDGDSFPDHRAICIEKCRPLHDRRSAELLLRPRGEGPISLAIPFELTEQDLSPLSDLILHPGLKFLTIDHIYCTLLDFDSGSLQEPSIPSRLSNLAALSIHRSNSDLDIDKLCDWLVCCDLELFQITQFQQLNNLSQSQTVKLLGCLWRHRNLQALALRIRCGEPSTKKVYADLEKEMGTTCWPRLKALYLGAVNEYWLEKLPTFEKLQILELRNVISSPSITVRNVAQSISYCRHLQVLDIEFYEVDDLEIFLIMAHGCPLLRRFCVRILNPSPEMTGDQFSQLLQALPGVELLSLSIWLRMTASRLRDLATSCPWLTMLELTHTRLDLSLESLAEVPALPRLGEMSLASVWFENPNRYMRLSGLQSIASEWNRVFPRIRRMPCSADVYGPEICIEESPSSKEPDSGGDRWGTNNDSNMSLDDAGLDLEDYGSDWFHMRRRLWKLLGYKTDSFSEVLSGIKHIWQTNLEIKTFGWPVLPMGAFLDPQTYSTAEVA